MGLPSLAPAPSWGTLPPSGFGSIDFQIRVRARTLSPGCLVPGTHLLQLLSVSLSSLKISSSEKPSLIVLSISLWIISLLELLFFFRALSSISNDFTSFI